MGYTRSWHRTTKKITPEFVKQAKLIVADCAKKGIRLRDNFGENEPVITMNCVAINGDAHNKYTDLSHETFQIDNKQLDTYDFCKTARKPYDYAVRLLLEAAEKEGLVRDNHEDGNEGYSKIVTDAEYTEAYRQDKNKIEEIKVLRVLSLLNSYLIQYRIGNNLIDMQQMLKMTTGITQMEVLDVIKKFKKGEYLAQLRGFSVVNQWLTVRVTNKKHLFKNNTNKLKENNTRKLFYVNDKGDNATIIIDNGKVKITTDLSASEKEYPSLEVAKHDLFTRGYYRRENA